MPRLRKSQIFNIVAFLIGTAVIVHLIRSIGYDTTREHLERTGWDFLWLFPIYLVTMLGDTVSWRLLIRRPVSMIRVMLAANSGTAINALTPSGDGGEFVKGSLIGSEIGTHEAVSSLLLWNFLYAVTKKIVTVAGPLLALLFGPFEADPKPLATSVVLWFLGLGILTAAYLPVVYWLVMRVGVERIARKVHRVPFLRKLDLSRVEHFSRQLDETFRDFGRRHKARLWGAGLLLLIVHVSVCFEIWFVLRLLGVQVSWATSVFLFTGSSLLQTVVSFSPVEMGVTEAGSMGLYQWIGYDPVYGFMQEFIRRLRRLVFNVIGLAYLGYRAVRPYEPPAVPDAAPLEGSEASDAGSTVLG